MNKFLCICFALLLVSNTHADYKDFFDSSKVSDSLFIGEQNAIGSDLYLGEQPLNTAGENDIYNQLPAVMFANATPAPTVAVSTGSTNLFANTAINSGTGSSSGSTSALSGISSLGTTIGSTLGSVSSVLGSLSSLTGVASSISSLASGSSSSSPFSFSNVNIAGALGQLAAATAFSQLQASTFDAIAKTLCSNNQTYYCAYVTAHSSVNNSALSTLNSGLNALGSTSTSATGSSSTSTGSTGVSSAENGSTSIGSTWTDLFAADSTGSVTTGSTELTNFNSDPIQIDTEAAFGSNASGTTTYTADDYSDHNGTSLPLPLPSAGSAGTSFNTLTGNSGQ